MIRPSIERSLISVRTALKMASMSPKDIQRVILVGGATCTPLVSQMLEEELQITPQAWIDPSTVVAIGAGIEAAQLSGQPLGPRLIDITPHSLGIECLDDFSTPRNYILIRRNTPLPCSNSRIFYKHFSGQEAIKISVYQGESQDPLKNQLLGKFTLDDLADSLGSDIHVKFHLDRSGLLEVAAVDISSGKQASRVLKRASNTRVKLTNLAELESVHIFTEEAEENDAEVLEIQEVKPEPASNPEEERQKLFQDAEALLNANSLEAADLEELSSVLAAAKEGDSAAIDRLSNLIYYLI
jgi:molecular chaperone DnaK